MDDKEAKILLRSVVQRANHDKAHKITLSDSEIKAIQHAMYVFTPESERL